MGVLRRVGLSPRELHLIAPGPLDQRTGGYLYNARIVEGLTTLGWRVVPHALDGSFPEGDAVAYLWNSSRDGFLGDSMLLYLGQLSVGEVPGWSWTVSA